LGSWVGLGTISCISASNFLDFGQSCHWRSENPVNSAGLKTGYGAVIFSSPT
jgi:hypothetical protein